MTLERIAAGGHEQVLVTQLDDVGLTCIIAIHSTQLGPALGGTRFREYASLDTALDDVLRLAEAMTYKNASAGLDHGGGKAVIVGDPKRTRSEPLMRAYGRAIASLGGRYVTACDVGTTPADMAVIRRETRWATGADPVDGGSGDSGIMTAVGVHLALCATAEFALDAPTLAGCHIAVQGLGKVGGALVHQIVADGAKVTVADTDESAVARVADLNGVDVVDVDEILHVDADIVSPNALGAVLNEQQIPHLQCRAICGGANNQLATEHDAERLRERGIVYAPDFIVNAGGVINVAEELHPHGYSEARARRRTESIPHTLDRVLREAERSGTTTHAAAIATAKARIEAVSATRALWLGQ